MEPAAAADQGAMISQLGGRRSRRVALNHSEFIIGGDGGDGGNGNSFLIMSRRPAQGGRDGEEDGAAAIGEGRGK